MLVASATRKPSAAHKDTAPRAQEHPEEEPAMIIVETMPKIGRQLRGDEKARC